MRLAPHLDYVKSKRDGVLKDNEQLYVLFENDYLLLYNVH